MTTSVIVPCWNALALTRVCLSRLAALTDGPLEIVAVDNGSHDGTGAWLSSFRRALRGPSMILIRNKANRGYPAAMNQGLAAARGRWLVFGNADAAVTRGWDAEMRAALRGAGGVSPASNPPGGRAPYRSTAELDRFAAAASLAPGPAFVPSAGFVPGFWFMTTRADAEQVGAFDERFSPGGFEDWDWQWRLREAGRKIGFAPRAFVHHEWFGVGGRNGLTQRELYSNARRRLLTEKHPATAAVAMEVHSY